MTKIQEQVVAVQDRIYREEYYPHLWDRSLARYNMSTASIDQHEHDDKRLVAMVNHFWMLLPDSPEIRTGPFFAVCDVAEHCFDEDDDA